MANNDRIPVPWSHRLRRFRYQVLPFLGFPVFLALTIWLWEEHARVANSVGEVELVQADVRATVDGLLVSLSVRGVQLTRFAHVQEGDVVARLDDTQARAELRVLTRDLARLSQEVVAQAVRIERDDYDRQVDYRREKTRFAWQKLQRQINLLNRMVLVETDKVELQRRDEQLTLTEPLREEGQVSEFVYLDIKLGRDEVQKRLEKNQNALKIEGKQLRLAIDDLNKYAAFPDTDLNMLIAPLEAEVATQNARIRVLQIQIEALEIRAPFEGSVAAIHCWPGQDLRAGDPIITIVQEHGTRIVSYVRENQGIRPKPNEQVDIRLRRIGSRPLRSSVESVGPTFELIPLHQRRDPTRPEWGLPVLIALPNKVSLKPGELVDVTFAK